eukprot:TRINITY_DN57652_c0_g1_i4.p1 TRINITY_DN57652_c0_g1~~TRINITY_DN57652_c0_g1_i4.p1  ORF type:complete len:105 (-),score=14.41 TRINITY_DN57652_c0_g1_i4:166-480(-)
MSLSGINGEKVPLSYYCRSMSRTAWRQGRSFGLWGFYFGGVLAVIEKRRGKNDYLNPFVAGAVSACMPTGMAMGGPTRVAVRAIGGGVFVAALEKVFNALQGIE